MVNFIKENNLYIVIWSLVIGVGLYKNNDVLLWAAGLLVAVFIATIVLSTFSYMARFEYGKIALVCAVILYLTWGFGSALYSMVFAPPHKTSDTQYEYEQEQYQRNGQGRF